jgi:HlyD family secretion protein
LSAIFRRAVLAVAALGLLAASPAVVCLAAGIEAISRPSEDVTLSFVRPGRVAKVLVKEGDTVQQGQVLVAQDDEAEQVQAAQLKAQAEDTTKVKAAEAQLDQKKGDLAKWEEVFKKGAATGFERDHAKLDMVIAELSLQLAQFEHEQDQRKYQEMKVELERMRLKSPFAGKVEKLFVGVGESPDVQAKVVRVVKTDPLWIDVPVLLDQARGLKVGQESLVALPASSNTNAPDPVKGRIIHVAAVADAASDTLTVRVEVANPTARPAGEHVFVSLPVAAGAATEAEKTVKNPLGNISNKKE